MCNFSITALHDKWRTALYISLAAHFAFLSIFRTVANRSEHGFTGYMPMEMSLPDNKAEGIDSNIKSADVLQPKSVVQQSDPPALPHAETAAVNKTEATERNTEEIVHEQTAGEAPQVIGSTGEVPVAVGNKASTVTVVRQEAAAPSAASASSNTFFHSTHRLSKLPYFIRRVEPEYPESERAAGIETRVLAEVCISDKGDVEKVRIVKSGGERFDRVVIEALKTSSFNPGFINEKPVAARVQIPFVFKLK